MKPTINFLFIAIGVLTISVPENMQGQNKVNYNIIVDDPNLDKISNLFINPTIMVDFPMYSTKLDELPIMAGTIGYGIRATSFIKGRFIGDAYWWRGIWPAKASNLELGGAMILNKKTKTKDFYFELSQTESGDKIKIEYLEIPGTQLNFSGVRGGFYLHNSVFEDSKIEGTTRSLGLYGGWTFGTVRNMKIKTDGGRYRENTQYMRYYLDVIVAVNNHTFVSQNTASAMPFGFRIGRDMNYTTTGIFKTVTNVELGYRPGFNGFYIAMAFTPVSIRAKLEGLN